MRHSLERVQIISSSESNFVLDESSDKNNNNTIEIVQNPGEEFFQPIKNCLKNKGTKIILFSSPQQIEIKAHLTTIVYLFICFISVFGQKIVVSWMFISGPDGTSSDIRTFVFFLLTYHVYSTIFNSFFYSRLIGQNYEMAKRCFLNAVSSFGQISFFVGAYFYFLDLFEPTLCLFCFIPYIICTLTTTIVSKGYFKFIYLYDFLESFQMLAISYKLTNREFDFDWDFVLIFYEFMTKVAMWTVILFWIGLISFIVITCVIYYKSRITQVDLFIVFLGMIFFNIIWYSYCYKFMFDGFKELLQANSITPLSERLQINYTLYCSCLATIVLSSFSIVVVILFYQRIKQMLVYYLNKEDRISKISMTSFVESLQLKMIKISGGYFKKVQKNDETTEPNKEANGKDTEEERCSICYENICDVIIDPCGHSGFCVICITNSMKEKKTCPICRQLIEKVYLISLNHETENFEAIGSIDFA